MIQNKETYTYKIVAGCVSLISIVIPNLQSEIPTPMKHLIIFFIFITLPTLIQAQTATAPSGSGTSGDPYLVATLDNLYWITQNSSSWGAYFKQTADIDASSTSGWDSGNGFLPIGNSSTKFTGTYDGDGHTISTLIISRSGLIGLFGVASGSEIKNIGVISIGYGNSSTIGGIAGILEGGSISNCYSTGVFSGNSSSTMGGLVGSNSGSISHSYSTVSGGGGDNVGGLVGYNSGSINNSYSTGDVSGSGGGGTQIYVGNLVGRNFSSGTISSTYSTGDVSTGYILGGLVGFNSGSISDSYGKGEVAGTSGANGGLVGLNQGSVNSSYSTAIVAAGTNPGGLVGVNQSTVDSDSFWDTEVSGQASSHGGTGKTTSEMTSSTPFTNAGWDFSDTWNIDAGINDGYPALLWQTEFGTVAPTAESGAATSITSSSVTMNGTVNPGRENTVVRFVYGTVSETYTDSIEAIQSSLNGWGEMSVSADVSGLNLGTTYYFRSAAENSKGYVQGTELSFTATDPPEAPTTSTEAATSISFTTVTLNGDVNPNNASTVVRFLYGTESGTYTDSLVADQSPLSGFEEESISADLSNLTLGQTYYVRVAAVNSEGYVRGGEINFTTKQAPDISTEPGTGLSLNGSNQYVSISDDESLQLTNNLTIEAWVKPTASYNETILDKGSYNYLFQLFSGGNSALGFYNQNNGWIYSSGNVPINQWSHVAVVFQTGTNGLKFYLNGTLLSQHTPSSTLATNSGELNIGRQAPGTCNCNLFNGKLDEVAIWNVARSQQQIRESIHKTLEGTETGLVSYWQFNEGSGIATSDSIGLNHGILQNGTIWETSTIPIGGGTNTSVAGFSSGTASMGTVSLTTTDPFDSPVDITATQLDLAPNQLVDKTVLLSDRYWVINAFGNPGSFSGDLTFTVPSGLTGSGTTQASDFTLYTRSSTSEGDWTLAVDGASSVSDTEVTFAGITAFSQFMIGIDSLEQEITGNEGWRMLSSPVSGISYGELLDTLWTQGFTGADHNEGISNVYTWDEENQQFESIVNASDVLEVGRGVLVYVFDDQNYDDTPDGFPKTIRVDSIQNSGTISPNLTYTEGVSDSVGWNLLGNPYGSAIDWDASTGWTKTNVDGSFYVWNASAGEYQSHNGSIGTLPNALIAPWQGFWVKATASSPALSLTDDVRSSGGALLKKQPVPQLRFTISDEQRSSSAIVMLNKYSTLEKDSLDAYKLKPLNSEYLSLFTKLKNGTPLDINSLPADLAEPIFIDMDYHFFVNQSERHSVLLEWDIANFPSDWEFELTDNQTGKTIQLNKTLNYEFKIDTKGKSQPLEISNDLASPSHGILYPQIIQAKTGTSGTDSRFTLTILSGTAVSSELEITEVPTKVILNQNYPNPFNPSTTIGFGLPQTSKVTLEVFDILGRKVATLFNNENKSAGRHTITFDARNLASGMYIYRLQTGNTIITKKLTLIK